MKLAANSNRQITLYYNATSILGKQALADAKATNAQLREIDITKEKVSGTEWVKVAKLLDLSIMDLINQEHSVFKNIYGNKTVNLSEEDGLKILEKHPETLVYPIAIRGRKGILVKQSTDMRKLKSNNSKGTNLDWS